MSRDWFDAPVPKMPTLADLNRGEDEAYDDWRQEQLERHAKHAEKRIVIPERDEDERRGEE